MVNVARFLIVQNLSWELASAAALILLFGFDAPWLASVVALGGLLVAWTLRRVMPVPVFQPVGGSYHVGIKHLAADASRGRSPIAAYLPTLIQPPVEGEPWLPHSNDVRYLKGIAKFGGVPAFVLRHLELVTMKCTRNAAPLPLKASPGVCVRPIIVLSHGLGANYQLYSLLAMDLAARGAIVLCPEHQDGSPSFSRDVFSDDNVKPYIESPPSGTTQERVFREEQLQHREREIEAILRSLDDATLFRLLCFSRKEIADVASAPSLAVTLVGHSFGASSVLHTAVTWASISADLRHQRFGKVKIDSCVCFDAWHFPLQHGTLVTVKDIANGRVRYSGVLLPPVLLLESQEWQRWTVSAQFQRDLIVSYRSAGDALAMSSGAGPRPPLEFFAAQEETLGTDHMSVCDMSVLSPVVSRNAAIKKPRQQITSWARRVLVFMAGVGSVAS